MGVGVKERDLRERAAKGEGHVCTTAGTFRNFYYAFSIGRERGREVRSLGEHQGVRLTNGGKEFLWLRDSTHCGTD